MKQHGRITTTMLAPLLVATLAAPVVRADIPGVTDQDPGTAGAQFHLWARSANVVLGDGNSLVAWGYSTHSAAGISYPGPTLIVNEGDVVSITLDNGLLVPQSIVFPGQAGVTAIAGTCGPPDCTNLMAQEAKAAPVLNGAGGSVTYSFTATRPGTYLYHSGSRMELSVEMGLVGALIVRPQGYAEGTHASHPDRTAYGTPAGAVAGYQPTHYDREYLFLLTEMDRAAHEAVDARQQAYAAGSYTGFDDPALDAVPGTSVDPAAFKATLWFLNGRNAPDTMLQRSVAWMPNQPYNALARAHAGERVLMRIIGAGRDLHPFHHHGNNAWLVARDGRILESTAGSLAPYPDYECLPEFDPGYAARVAGGQCPNLGAAPKPAGTTPVAARLPDQAISNFTIQVVPGSTYDAIFTWTGRGLNWDIYGSQPGHTAGSGTCDESTRLPGEDPVSHCHAFNDPMGARSFPVTLPEQQSLTFGGFWSGGPYLGTAAAVPPLQGGLNPGAGYTFMWHSHTERELTNDDVFPGGMMTMFILEQEPAAGQPDNICNDGSLDTGTCPP